MKRTFRLTAVAAVLALVGLGTPASAAEKKPKETKAAPAAPAATAPVDINTADVKAIAALPGVGEKLAAEIVKGRPYKSVNELDKVKGIGEKKLAKLKPLVTVGGAPAAAPAAPSKAAPAAVPAAPAAPAAAPAAAAVPAGKAAPAAKVPALAPGQIININSATAEELDKLPGIGPVKAAAIVEYRKQLPGGKFASVEDIMKVKGIKEGEFAKIKDLISVK